MKKRVWGKKYERWEQRDQKVRSAGKRLEDAQETEQKDKKNLFPNSRAEQLVALLTLQQTWLSFGPPGGFRKQLMGPYAFSYASVPKVPAREHGV
jgi:hypothetical protein